VANLGAVSVRSYRFVALERLRAKLSLCRNLPAACLSAYVNMSIRSCDESESDGSKGGSRVVSHSLCGGAALEGFGPFEPFSIIAFKSPGTGRFPT
jgi:hypothetical protein